MREFNFTVCFSSIIITYVGWIYCHCSDYTTCGILFFAYSEGGHISDSSPPRTISIFHYSKMLLIALHHWDVLSRTYLRLLVTHKLLLHKVRSNIYIRWKSRRPHIKLSYVNTLGGSIAAMQYCNRAYRTKTSHSRESRICAQIPGCQYGCAHRQLIIQILDRKMPIFLVLLDRLC